MKKIWKSLMHASSLFPARLSLLIMRFNNVYLFLRRDLVNAFSAICMKSLTLLWFLRKITLHVVTNEFDTALVDRFTFLWLVAHEAFARRVKTTYHPQSWHSSVQFSTEKIRCFHCHRVTTRTWPPWQFFRWDSRGRGRGANK